MMTENILRKLVKNSQTAIDDGVYDIDIKLQAFFKNTTYVLCLHKNFIRQ